MQKKKKNNALHHAKMAEHSEIDKETVRSQNDSFCSNKYCKSWGQNKKLDQAPWATILLLLERTSITWATSR
jgi:hypothetical protein